MGDGSHEPDMWPESLKEHAENIQQVFPQQVELDHAWWSCCTSVNWFASFLGLKNACLLVPQQEPVLVKKLTWWVSRDGTDDGEF